MSALDLVRAEQTACVILDKITRPDGYGGVITDYVDGAKFPAAITFDTSMQARAAQQAGVKSLYTVTTPKSIVFKFHDVFRREEDGKVFRVTSDGDDKFSPKMSTLDMRQVTAEEWSV